MEKIININLQGRVIPIEETAYNSLKQYIDSLRNHFAHEEGKDEIINDIENRIAELLSYRLKQGPPCINNNDLGTVINSIGRLEDIAAAEGAETNAPKSNTAQPESAPVTRGRFYRNADDKVIAGVCSGIADRMGVDPVVVRVLFVLLLGAMFWIYIILWIIVPSQSIQKNVTRRLYRNPDDKVIGGVCGGLAVYFNVATWVPRLIFVLPLLIGVLSRSMFSLWWWHLGMGPRIFTGSFGSSLFILYVILWIALPYASSATDKLEMRGEKIDLNSIKAASQANTVSPPRRRSGFGRVIGILFKAFFLFIAGAFALSFFGVLVGLMFGGFVAMPVTNFFLDGWGQNMMAWCGLALFLGIPFLALITWIVRRLIGIRSHRHYLGYVFAGLWIIGLVSVLALTGIFIRDFSSRSTVEEVYQMQQPSTGKLYINANDNDGRVVNNNHFNWYYNRNNDEAPFHLVSKDALWLNTVKVSVAQSADSMYHIYETRISRGETSEDAKNLASNIMFAISQQDSVINLPAGFTINSKDKFRNQQVLVTVEVPLGKEIVLGEGIKRYRWFNINVDRRRGNYNYERGWDNSYKYRSRWEYIMTPSGIKSTHGETRESDEDDDDD